MSFVPGKHSLLRQLKPLVRARYRTNLYQSQYSKLNWLRLTLVVLRFLRVPLMVRTAIIALLLVPLVAKAASAARINAVPTHAHASISRSNVHRARRATHLTSRRTPRRAASAAKGRSASTRAPQTARRRSTQPFSSSRYHRASAGSRAVSMRRARYNRYRGGARFVPLAAVPSAQWRTVSATQDVPDSTIDSAPNSSAAMSDPRPAGPSAAPTPVPAETDTAPAPGADPATMAAAGNPLAAPRAAGQPVGSIAGQVAELTRPPIFTGRVSSYTLRGNHDSLVRQNARSEEEALERIEDDADLQDRIAHGLLVPVPASGALIVNAALPEDRRYCRPWTANFLRDLSREHHAAFHSPLIVSSAVRTVEFQKRLMRINRNAADAEGDIVSPHLTGGTIDIAKSGLSRREMLWMRNQLLSYQNAGVIDVEEEFRQRCFHITVYKNYVSTEQQARRTSKALSSQAAGDSDLFDGSSTADAAPND
jgi:hypothetical protein